MTHSHLVQQGWIKAKDFTNMYNLSESIVCVCSSTTKTKHIKKVGNILYINHSVLKMRREFHHRVWLEATDNYYLLIDGASQFKLARVLSKYLGGTSASWTVWMDNVLFSTAYMDRSLLHYKIPEKLWEFWRFTRWMIKIIKKKILITHTSLCLYGKS